jgi:hypothetical protein
MPNKMQNSHSRSDAQPDAKSNAIANTFTDAIAQAHGYYSPDARANGASCYNNSWR